MNKKLVKLVLIFILGNCLSTIYAAQSSNNFPLFHLCFYTDSEDTTSSKLLSTSQDKVCYDQSNQLKDLPTPFMRDAFYALETWLTYLHPQTNLGKIPLEVAIHLSNRRQRGDTQQITSQNPYPLRIKIPKLGIKTYQIYPVSADALFNYGDISGRDTNAYEADILIELNSQYTLQHHWMDPEPNLRDTKSAYIPPNSDKMKSDMTSIFLHEFGHGFGIEGNRYHLQHHERHLTFYDVHVGNRGVSNMLDGQMYGDFWANFVDSGTCASVSRCRNLGRNLSFYGKNTAAYLQSQGLSKGLPLSQKNYVHFDIYAKDVPGLELPPRFKNKDPRLKYCRFSQYRQQNVIIRDVMTDCFLPRFGDDQGFPQGRMRVQTLDIKVMQDLGYNVVKFPSL